MKILPAPAFLRTSALCLPRANDSSVSQEAGMGQAGEDKMCKGRLLQQYSQDSGPDTQLQILGFQNMAL